MPPVCRNIINVQCNIYNEDEARMEHAADEFDYGPLSQWQNILKSRRNICAKQTNHITIAVDKNDDRERARERDTRFKWSEFQLSSD